MDVIKEFVDPKLGKLLAAKKMERDRGHQQQHGQSVGEDKEGQSPVSREKNHSKNTKA